MTFDEKVTKICDLLRSKGFKLRIDSENGLMPQSTIYAKKIGQRIKIDCIMKGFYFDKTYSVDYVIVSHLTIGRKYDDYEDTLGKLNELIDSFRKGERE